MNSGFTSITSTTYEYTRMVLHCDIKAGTQQDVRVLRRVARRVSSAGRASSSRAQLLHRSTSTSPARARGFIAPMCSVGHKASWDGRRRMCSRPPSGAAARSYRRWSQTHGSARCAATPGGRCCRTGCGVRQMDDRSALLRAVELNHDEACRLLLLTVPWRTTASPKPPTRATTRPTMLQVLQILSKASPPPRTKAFPRS